MSKHLTSLPANAECLAIRDSSSLGIAPIPRCKRQMRSSWQNPLRSVYERQSSTPSRSFIRRGAGAMLPI